MFTIASPDQQERQPLSHIVSAALTVYEKPLVRRLIEKVTVESKSGVTVDVDE